MIKIISAFILLILFCTACKEEKKQEEKDADNGSKMVAKETIIKEHEKETIVLSELENEVYQDALNFIKWYIENRDSLLAKRERIVQTNKEYVAIINLKFLEDYLLFLKEEGSNCLSTKFVESEKKYWQKAHNETLTKPVYLEDGPDPWCFDADPIFNGHEWPSSSKEWIEDWNGDIGKETISVEGNNAEFFFELERAMVKEADKWKMKNWFND